MKTSKFTIGIIIGFVLWAIAIYQGDDFGVVKAMVFIVFIHILDINSQLSQIKKEKEEVPK